MKYVRNIAIVILLTCLIFSMIPTKVNALDFDGIKSAADGFLSKGKGNEVISGSSIENFVIPIGQMLSAIALVVIVVVTVIMGIKYVMASSNPEEQAKLKTQLIGLVISAVVIFGAQAIWAMVYNFMNEVT